MRFINPCIVALLSSIVVFAPTHASIINVPDDHETIQGGIDAAEPLGNV